MADIMHWLNARWVAARAWETAVGQPFVAVCNCLRFTAFSLLGQLLPGVNQPIRSLELSLPRAKWPRELSDSSQKTDYRLGLESTFVTCIQQTYHAISIQYTSN